MVDVALVVLVKDVADVAAAQEGVVDAVVLELVAELREEVKESGRLRGC